MLFRSGSRTKIAVKANSEEVDPVGACVGQKGMRVQNVINELNGEKIDVIKYSDNVEDYLSNALSPAKVLQVIPNKDNKTAVAVVDDYQLSLAIGKEGQNVRLAAKLTGWKIDIKSKTVFDASTTISPLDSVLGDLAVEEEILEDNDSGINEDILKKLKDELELESL